jgi:hypothetical protein
MASKPNLQYANLLFEAINAQHGIRVATDNVPTLRQKLYAERKKSASFELLSFVPCPDNPTGELWIIHRPEESA